MKKLILMLSFLVPFSFACQFGTAFAEVNSAHQTGKSLIAESKAKEIALQKVKGEVVSCHLEEDDGRQVYEVKINQSGTFYEIEIDAKTGQVLEVEKEGSRNGNGDDDGHDDDGGHDDHDDEHGDD